MEKVVCSALDLSEKKKDFHIGQVLITIYGFKTLFLHITHNILNGMFDQMGKTVKMLKTKLL